MSFPEAPNHPALMFLPEVTVHCGEGCYVTQWVICSVGGKNTLSVGNNILNAPVIHLKQCIVQHVNLLLSAKQWAVTSLKTNACLINIAGTNYHFTAQKSSVAVVVMDVTRLKNNDEMQVPEDRLKWQDLHRQLNSTKEESSCNNVLPNKWQDNYDILLLFHIN